MANWIKKATSNAHGQFAAKANRADMTTREFARHVKANPEDYSSVTRRQAALARTLLKLRGR